MTGIIALTYKRVEETARTWSHNMSRLVQSTGFPYPVYWWDNTPHGPEREALMEMAKNYNVVSAFHDGSNYGIAEPINKMAAQLFADGCTGFVTMASDILEPAGWITAREAICDILPAGIGRALHRDEDQARPAKRHPGGL